MPLNSSLLTIGRFLNLDDLYDLFAMPDSLQYFF